MQLWCHWGQIMNGSIHRRVSVASCWASTRIALHDSFERYEDSYAITQEFREWITCIGEHPEHLEESVLKVPDTLNTYIQQEASETDEMLEI